MKKKMKTIFTFFIIFCFSNILFPLTYSTQGKHDTSAADNTQSLFRNDIVDQSQTAFERDMYLGCDPFGDSLQDAQSFIPQLGTLTRVELYIMRDNEYPPTKPFQVAIRERLTGQNLAHASVSPSNIPSYGTHEWITFNFDDIKVNIGQTYYIISYVEYASDAGAYAWGLSESDPYENGMECHSFDKGASWYYYEGLDFCFKTYGFPQQLRIENITGGIGKVKVEIKNIIGTGLQNINWSIRVTNGIFSGIDKETKGVIETLNTDETKIITTDHFIFGFGPIKIIATIEIADDTAKKAADGYEYFFIIICKK